MTHTNIACVALLYSVSAIAGETRGPGTSPGTGGDLAERALSFDLEERLRFEARSNNRDFDDSANDDNDDSWLVSRFRLGLTYRAAPWLMFYGQTQDSREWDSERPNVPGVRGAEGGDAFDLRQGYVEFGGVAAFPFAFTLGRQALTFGDARLIADSKWGNFGRTFDAVKLRYERAGFGSVDIFAARPVQIKEDVFNDSDSADDLIGIYATFDVLRFQTTDFYVLHRDKRDDQPDLSPTNRRDPRGASTGPAQRTTTIGTRSVSKAGAFGGWDYGWEAAYQFGELWTADRRSPGLDHRAFALHARGGYTWTQAAWRSRLGLEYNYASGDGDPSDGESGSFQNLFPSNFGPYGYVDAFAWRNMHNARLHFTFEPAEAVKAEVSYHAFWLADTEDYWFRSNGTAALRTRTPAGADVRTIGASNFAGHEIDLALTWTVTRNLSVLVGYSHFFAGDYLKDTGASDDADFAYLQATFAF
jgi:Alginate export